MNEQQYNYFKGFLAGIGLSLAIYACCVNFNKRYGSTRDRSQEQQAVIQSKLETQCKEKVIPKVALEIGNKKYSIGYDNSGKPELVLYQAPSEAESREK